MTLTLSPGHWKSNLRYCHTQYFCDVTLKSINKCRCYSDDQVFFFFFFDQICCFFFLKIATVTLPLSTRPWKSNLLEILSPHCVKLSLNQSINVGTRAMTKGGLMLCAYLHTGQSLYPLASLLCASLCDWIISVVEEHNSKHHFGKSSYFWGDFLSIAPKLLVNRS